MKSDHTAADSRDLLPKVADAASDGDETPVRHATWAESLLRRARRRIGRVGPVRDLRRLGGRRSV